MESIQHQELPVEQQLSHQAGETSVYEVDPFLFQSRGRFLIGAQKKMNLKKKNRARNVTCT